MAASVKEKNMPTISSNIYGGLQKWVNRASVSLRGRRRSRTNSLASVMTTYQRNQLESMTRDYVTHSGITPVHGRSRSNPVAMPDSLTFESDHQRIPQVYKQSRNGRSRKESFENSDDSSSRGSLHDIHEARDLSALNKTLSNNLSKSESDLLDGKHYSRRSKSLTTASGIRRRKSSQDTDASLDSNLSEVDINDANKKSRSSQSLSKTNKRNKRHSVDCKADSMGANKTEQSSTTTKNIEQMSKNIHSRLDMWLEKTTGFQESRQSSFESTSSSDDIFGESNNKIRQDETKHFRDLQTALDELVSSCGKSSARNSMIMTNTDENSNTRKISLKNAGTLFNKTVEIDGSCLQDERQKIYRSEKCGSSSDSGSSREKQLDEEKEGKVEERCNEEMNDLETSCDSVDGFTSVRDENHDGESTKDYRSDIGPNTKVTRATDIMNDHASTDPQTTNQNPSNPIITNVTISDHEESNGDLPLNGSPISSKEKKFSFENKSNLLPKPSKSSKSFRAPIPPCKNSEKECKDTTTPVFDDDDLTAFALKCVEVSKKTQSLGREERRSKSDSDEEKKTALNLDYVYIPKSNVKASTHPKTSFDKKGWPQGALSDDESYTTHPKYEGDKRNSQDSLDGLVLFHTSKDIEYENTENKSQSSNENESTKEMVSIENAGYGLRKFPSMPLFYVPNDGTRKSIGKSLWKKLKSLPRQTENHRTPVVPKTKHSTPSLQTDPFYHGEQDEEIISEMRPKSHSMAIVSGEKRRRRRLSLEPKLSASLPISVSLPVENKTPDECVIKTEPQPDESQC